ncbi:hypothetical protein SAMN05216404_106243 [Nitrosospira multiformis]|uniref:Uncharacterized protein n=1 Tax=Nitrosospira multiformis TaxID=1231 RepID=A0A1H8J223_9PROT|nr:hypothetical protein [Nitrosospira multiformis]SEN74018.1 hypothetical protein SAMN05216404_106243 [Nitrosospira multiformis]
MGRHYSPKSFFRHVPNAMLKQYFDKAGVLTEHDFSGVPEAKIELIYKAWLSLPDALQRKTERDFKEIDALACEGGIKAIIDEARRQGGNIAEILSQKEGFHEKVFWVFLERPEYWARQCLLSC